MPGYYNKSKSRKSYRKTSYKFTPLNKPLQYGVYCKDTCVIPEGATGVEIAFRQSPFLRRLEHGECMRMNVYKWKGRIYHG